jgi:hypothetical protein
MTNDGLFGPNPLNHQGVDSGAPGYGPGAYALGHLGYYGAFQVRYVGRSDADPNARLKSHIGSYAYFKHAYYPTAHEAFVRECVLFHDFGELTLDNAIHPARPQGTSWTCPRCTACG